MLAEVRIDAPLLRTTLREAPVREISVEQLDATEQVPLRTVCSLEAPEHADSFEAGLDADRTVTSATKVAATPQGYQYGVTHCADCPGTAVNDAIVGTGGVFVSGVRRVEDWEVRIRFPGRNAFVAFRERCADAAFGISTRAVHEREDAVRTEDYGASPPQREILLLAARRGYFEVPRQASLADLAGELDISSQAASERLRRGLDSVVERTLLAG